MCKYFWSVYKIIIKRLRGVNRWIAAHERDSCHLLGLRLTVDGNQLMIMMIMNWFMLGLIDPNQAMSQCQNYNIIITEYHYLLESLVQTRYNTQSHWVVNTDYTNTQHYWVLNCVFILTIVYLFSTFYLYFTLLKYYNTC